MAMELVQGSSNGADDKSTLFLLSSDHFVIDGRSSRLTVCAYAAGVLSAKYRSPSSILVRWKLLIDRHIARSFTPW
jgi:hypothetical protein